MFLATTRWVCRCVCGTRLPVQNKVVRGVVINNDNQTVLTLSVNWDDLLFPYATEIEVQVAE